MKSSILLATIAAAAGQTTTEYNNSQIIYESYFHYGDMPAINGNGWGMDYPANPATATLEEWEVRTRARRWGRRRDLSSRRPIPSDPFPLSLSLLPACPAPQLPPLPRAS